MAVVRTLLLVLCWLSASFLASEAQAQADSRKGAAESREEPAGYREKVAAALAEHEASNFEESRTLMLQAHAMFPSARTMRGLGMVAFELRGYADSVRWLEQALSSSVRPLEGELRAQTEVLLTRARAFTGRLSIELSPKDARLLVDGAEIAQTDRGALLLSVGEHVVEARAESFLPERRTVRLVGGEVKAVSLKLAPQGAFGPDSGTYGALREKPQERRAWYRNPWFWVSTGAVLVAGAATATALILTRDSPELEPPYLGLSGEPALVGPSQ